MADGAPDIGLDALRAMMAAQGVKQLLVKELAANDTSKNQPYLGGSLDILNVLPMGTIREDATTRGTSLKATLPLSWLTPGGALADAPHAQLILYPQYPEIRLSGFLKGVPRFEGGPNALMTSREAGRMLFLGITGDRRIIAWVAARSSRLAEEVRALGELQRTGVFMQVPMGAADTSRERLLRKLGEIHRLGWLASQRLYSGGTFGPCTGTNCGGFTLEAHFGIVPNGRAEPDFEGWELKGHTVNDFVRFASGPLTLMTPEPTGGYYKQHGAEAFVRKYGYPDKLGRADRLNFGGVHKIGERQGRTGLALTFIGYDPSRNRITDATGGFTLADDDGNEAATWHFAGLIEHWNRKHAKAAYVPFMARKQPAQQYAYGGRARLGEGTDFLRFLQAMASHKVYYDPGIKLEGAASTKPKTKRRSQFRIKSAEIGALYAKLETKSDVTRPYL